MVDFLEYFEYNRLNYNHLGGIMKKVNTWFTNADKECMKLIKNYMDKYIPVIVEEKSTKKAPKIQGYVWKDSCESAESDDIREIREYINTIICEHKDAQLNLESGNKKMYEFKRYVTDRMNAVKEAVHISSVTKNKAKAQNTLFEKMGIMER